MKLTKIIAGILFLSALSAQAANSRYLDGQFIRTTTGTLTLPTTTDTLLGRATTDTLSNKTISGSLNNFSYVPNAATSAASANTASAIVARDASGNFSAGTITATLNGAASSTSGNAATATALAADPTDCSASQFATGIAANGNLTCSSPSGLAIATSTKTADYTLSSADDVILAQAVTGTVVLTLPAASSNSGKVFRVKRIDALGTVLVRVKTTGADLLDLYGSLILMNNESAELISAGGSVWYVF